MKLTDKVLRYTKQHPQEVMLAWVDRKTTVCSAEEAKALCADRRISGRIVGAMAADKALENMLNKLLDAE